MSCSDFTLHSQYFGTSTTISQPRSLRGLAVDGLSGARQTGGSGVLYTGFIRVRVELRGYPHLTHLTPPLLVLLGMKEEHYRTPQPPPTTTLLEERGTLATSRPQRAEAPPGASPPRMQDVVLVFHERFCDKGRATQLKDCCCWLCLFCLQGTDTSDVIKVSASPLQFLIGNGPIPVGANPYFSAGVIARTGGFAQGPKGVAVVSGSHLPEQYQALAMNIMALIHFATIDTRVTP